MDIPKHSNVHIYQKCASNDCNNLISKRNNFKYCNDEKCRAARKAREEYNKSKRKKYKDNTIYSKAINIHIPKNEKLITKTLIIQCCAISSNGIQCTNTISAPYNLQRTAYPKYCTEHANAWKRKLFEGNNNTTNTIIKYNKS